MEIHPMTNEEALKDLKAFYEIFKSEYKCDTSAFDIGIESISKQIPKLPVFYTEYEGLETFRCPTCNKILIYTFQRSTMSSLYHHCTCGQAIQW